jgi:hypothetical protein
MTFLAYGQQDDHSREDRSHCEDNPNPPSGSKTGYQKDQTKPRQENPSKVPSADSYMLSARLSDGDRG